MNTKTNNEVQEPEVKAVKQKPVIFSTPMVQAIQNGTKTQTRRIANAGKKCPYGEVGEELYVREAFCRQPDGTLIYKADLDAASIKQHKWKPSIHLPKADSRIRLKITEIRKEKLQEISAGDAKAEGIISSHPVDDFEHLWESLHGGGSWNVNPDVWVVCFEVVK